MRTLILAAAILLGGCGGPVTGPATTDPATQPSLGDTGQHGQLTVTDVQTISGQVGSLTVASGGDLTLNGMVTGDLVVEKGGRAQVLGMVIGNVVNRGGDVTVIGDVGGVLDEGGTTVVESGASVNGSQVP